MFLVPLSRGPLFPAMACITQAGASPGLADTSSNASIVGCRPHLQKLVPRWAGRLVLGIWTFVLLFLVDLPCPGLRNTSWKACLA